MRDQNLVAARFIAIVLMVLTHAAGPGFYSFGPSWPIIVGYEAIAHTAVPLFFMISGALLVQREEPVLTFYKKRYFKILPPLVFWSLVYIPVISRWPDPPAHLSPVSILTGPVSFHLWFVYTIASLYLLVPILRAFYARASLQLKVIALTLAGVSQTWDHFFKGVLKLNLGVDMHLFPQYVFFLLAGAFIYEHRSTLTGSRTKQAISLSMYTLLCALTAWLVKRDSIAHSSPQEMFFEYNSMNILLASVSLFCFLLALRVSKLPGLIEDIAEKSVGIYLCHWLFLGAGLYGSFCSLQLHFTLKWDTINPALSVPIVTIGGVVLAYTLCYVMAKVPILGRMV